MRVVPGVHLQRDAALSAKGGLYFLNGRMRLLASVLRHFGLISLRSGMALFFLGASLPVLAATAETPMAGADKADYTIGPGDSLQIFVWKEADLTREVTVRLDGKITVPLLGDVEAGGRTPEQLGGDIASRLRRFFEAPQVTVGLAHAGSSRFFVLGQVSKAGAFPLIGRTTLVQAMAQAEGFKEFAKLDRIVIIRDEKGDQSFLTVNYKKLEAGSDISQNIVLRPGDTILVP